MLSENPPLTYRELTKGLLNSYPQLIKKEVVVAAVMWSILA
jgi:hypothetical protein